DDAIVSLFIFVCSIFGCYGNVCFVLTVIRIRELRTARALLLSSLCVMHTVVLVNFFVSRICYAYGLEMTRKTCLLIYSLPPGIYAAPHHSVLYAVLVVDIAVSLIAPIRYKNFPLRKHVLIAQTPCVIYGMGLIVAHLLADSESGIVKNQCIFADAFHT
ncbi:hypothetical protein PMAYCL1PPCAC_14892, partial [Pristionchus mayeri]